MAFFQRVLVNTIMGLLIVGPCVAYVPDVGPGVCVGGCDTPAPPTYNRWNDRSDTPAVVEPQLTPEQIRQQEASRIFNQGYKAMKQGNLEDAARFFAAALGMFPENQKYADALCAMKWDMGIKTFKQGNYPLSLNYYEQIQGICPNYPNLQKTLSSIQQTIQYKAAEQRNRPYSDAYNAHQSQLADSKNRINKYLSDFNTGSSPLSPPPQSFQFIDPGDPLFSKGDQNSAPVVATHADFKPAPATSEPKQRPVAQKGFKMKDIPLPPDIVDYYKKHDPFGGGIQGPTQTTDLILDALKMGGGSLQDSVIYLSKRVQEQGDNYHGVIALSYLEGLERGAVGHPESRPTQKQQDERALFELLTNQTSPWADELYTLMLNKNNKQDDPWLSERTKLVKEAMQAGHGDLYKSMAYLKDRYLKQSTYSGDAIRHQDPILDAEEDHAGWSAYYYILGYSVYPGLKPQK
jgi:hypothetical protein